MVQKLCMFGSIALLLGIVLLASRSAAPPEGPARGPLERLKASFGTLTDGRLSDGHFIADRVELDAKGRLLLAGKEGIAGVAFIWHSPDKGLQIAQAESAIIRLVGKDECQVEFARGILMEEDGMALHSFKDTSRTLTMPLAALAMEPAQTGSLPRGCKQLPNGRHRMFGIFSDIVSATGPGRTSHSSTGQPSTYLAVPGGQEQVTVYLAKTIDFDVKETSVSLKIHEFTNVELTFTKTADLKAPCVWEAQSVTRSFPLPKEESAR